MDELRAVLRDGYGIGAGEITPVAGGFSAKAAYRVAGDDGADYFVKMYDRALPTTRFFVERIDACMPVLARLSAGPALRGHVLEPVRALDGGYKAETRGGAYVLFLYVQGDVPGIDGVTLAQTRELAGILAALHEADAGDLPPALREDVELPFCGRLEAFLRGPRAGEGPLGALLAPHADLLLRAVGEVLRLRDSVRRGYAPLVLCHGDAHGNNLMQGERLVLVDWEDLRLAPAEADLFIYAWHPHGEALLEAYSAARSGYAINRELLRFYVLRRRIEDVWVDIERLTEEETDEAEAAELLGWVRQGVGAVGALCRGR